MITAKQVYGTYPHVQMRWYIERTKPEATKAQKAAFLGQLVGKFVANCNAQHPDDDVPEAVWDAFVWDDTQEGHDYWRDVHGPHPVKDEFKDEWLKPVVVGRVKPVKAKPPLPAPKLKRVGWWA